MSARTLRLTPHPDFPEPAVQDLTVTLEPQPEGIALRYRLDGAIDRLAIPAPGATVRADDLWRHTCFEAFVRTPGGYREFNLSPSSAWAAYDFTDYRVRTTDPDVAAPAIVVTRGADHLVLETVLPIRTGRVSVTAVVETAEGRISYWALAHAPGKPDFHHPDGFVLDLDTP